MTVNPDQAIFDAIAAATRYNRKLDAVSISTQKFIETFNGHRDRKLCTSLNLSAPVFHAPHNHGERVPSSNAALAGADAILVDELAAAFACTLSTQEGGQEHLNAEETLRRILWDNAAVIIAGLRKAMANDAR